MQATGLSPQWTDDGRYIVYEDDGSVNTFSTVGVLELVTMKLHRFRLPRPDAYRLYVAPDSRIYVSWEETPLGEAKRVAVFDLSGKVLKYVRLPDVVLSAHQRYCAVVPFEAGTGPASIVRLSDRKVTSQFDFARHPVWDVVWSPTDDDYALLEIRQGSPGDQTVSYELFRVSERKILRSFREDKWLPIAWSPDGSAVVVFRGGHFVFESVTQ